MLGIILTGVRRLTRIGATTGCRYIKPTGVAGMNQKTIAFTFSRGLGSTVPSLRVKSLKFIKSPLRSFHRTAPTLAGTFRNPKGRRNADVVLFFASGVIFMVGLSYVAVPLYRMFCQATGMGGDPKLGQKIENISTMEPIRERPITVVFNADRHSAMRWNFKPSQHKVTVVPGETALAFYTAKNPTDEPIVGVATYNVVPFQAGPYFNKIQCFCFEEQWLNPHEEVDMPVFFYIDPEFDSDPQLAAVDEIILSYTFFKAEAGMTLPIPGFMNTAFKGANDNASVPG